MRQAHFEAGQQQAMAAEQFLKQAVMAPLAVGRVVSFFTSARFGFDAVGGLLAGALATVLGAGHSLLLEGGLLLCFVAFMLTRRRRLLRAVADNQQH